MVMACNAGTRISPMIGRFISSEQQMIAQLIGSGRPSMTALVDEFVV
jgi:hypothetical protein